jgi:hypothetical protein
MKFEISQVGSHYCGGDSRVQWPIKRQHPGLISLANKTRSGLRFCYLYFVWDLTEPLIGRIEVCQASK